MADNFPRWREPTARLPLRWGLWADRSWLGLTLIVGGGVAIAGSNAPTAWLAASGVVAHLIGWCIMPASGWRRVVVALPSTFAMATLLAGTGYLIALLVPFFAWMLVRHRPMRVWPMGAFVIAAGMILGRVFPEYNGMLPALGVMAAVLVGAAWSARAVHAATDRPSARRTSRRQGPKIS